MLPSDSEDPAKAQFANFSELCERLAGTAKRLERARLIADYLTVLAPEDVETAARLLLGRAFSEAQGRRLTLGGRAVWDAVATAGGIVAGADWAAANDFGELVRRAVPAQPARAEPLTLATLAAAFHAIAASGGAGSRRQRIALLADLFRRATPLEAKYLAKIVIGEMRHGAQEGTVLEALAIVAGVPVATLRRAQQALGDIGAVAVLARTNPAHLAAVAVRLFTPIKPMLAQTAADVAAAFAAHAGQQALEWKLDGARVQIHKSGDEVRVFSRRLRELTASLPDVVALVRRDATAHTAIYEGEVIAVRDGRPLPFQDLMRRFRRTRDITAVAEEIPIELHLFDVLYRDGESLLDRTAVERWAELDRARGRLARVPSRRPVTVADGEAFYREALAAGHEGVMAKALSSPYTPGIRGAAWLKVKASVTLDLVIIAAEWGYGRRHGWLSNYHLAARDPAHGALAMVGKTFKGPTDAEFAALTARLLALRTAETAGTVTVRPEVVVEVKFDDIQKSALYPCGMALRFARIVRVRDDKRAEDADTVDTVRQLFERTVRGTSAP